MYVRKQPPSREDLPVPAALSNPPYATLLTFSRYVGRTGPAKATFVGGLRRARQARSGFNPHARFVKALKADIARPAGARELETVVDAVQPRWRPLYTALRAGGEHYLASLGDRSDLQVVPVRAALDVIGGLTVKVNPHFGLRYGDGRREVVRLHFDEQAPSEELVVATLRLLDRQMAQILPHAQPVLVDVRRGTSHRLDPKVPTEEVERWLAGEALAFSSMWRAAA
jgi:hypothetical protein